MRAPFQPFSGLTVVPAVLAAAFACLSAGLSLAQEPVKADPILTDMATGGAAAGGQGTTPNKAGTRAPDDGADPKRGRITPFNGAVMPDTGAAPVFVPVDKPKDKGREKKADPTGGASVFDRMGVALPALPVEKAYVGKVDEAFGAFQRGYYLTAMDLALPRAEAGDPAAQTLVAVLMEAGLGVARNPKEAAFWYGQAANGGDPIAMFKYAVLLIEGRNVTRDKVKSLDFMRRAADLGNASAQFDYAQTLVADTPGDKGLKAAMPYYEKAAEHGIADAQYALSQIYMNVDGIDDDHRGQARTWLTRAARAGFDTAQLDLAIWLVEGIGGERNLDEGFSWMRKAAERGNVVAQNKLSHLYVNAIGVRPDPVEAAKWYVLSRRAGLNDVALEDFYLGLDDSQQEAARKAADAYTLQHPQRKAATP